MIKDNYKLYKSEINLDNNLKIKQKSIFLSDINVKNKIISYEDLIVVGNINAEYLLVSGNLIVSGKINVKEIDIEGSLIYSDASELQNLNVDGEIISIDELKNSKNRLKIEEINIKNIEQYTELLSDISCLRLKLIKDICDNESDYFLEKVYKKFKELEDVFVEFKSYNEFISLLISKYRNPAKYDMKLINYLRVINYKYELPNWLLEISSIKLILIKLENLSINDMIVDLENKDEINRIKYMTYKCEKILNDKFDQILSKININEYANKDNQILSIINSNECVNKDVSVDDLFKKYSREADNYNLIEGHIKEIKQTRIVLEIEDKVKAILTDYYDIGDKSQYKIGDKISVCILKIYKLKSGLEIDVYRNSIKCMYESICKLNIPSLKNIKKTDLEIVNNEELFITNYIGDEKIEVIEKVIKNELLLNNIIILHKSDSKIKNISKIFNVSEDIIIKVNDKEYEIKTFYIEHCNTINMLFSKYKKILLSMGIERVSSNMISIRSKYNSYRNKMNKLVEGEIKEVSDNEYIVHTEEHVIGKLSKIDANQEYSVGSRMIAKVESISLGNDCVYLRFNNVYDNYVKELVDYKIKELNINDMIDKVDVLININKVYNVKIVLNEGYDLDLINTLKNDVGLAAKNNNIIFSTIVKKVVKEKCTTKTLNNSFKQMDTLGKSNENLDKYISTSEIIKIFNQKKKECGVPEIRIIKNARIEKYKTVIICSKLALNNDKIKLLALEYDMELELKGEKIKIVVYDEDIKSIVADMINVGIKNLDIDKNKRSIKINIDKKASYNIDLKKEKTLLSMILPYYKIEFIILDEKSNKENITTKSDEKQENVDDDILNLLFK